MAKNTYSVNLQSLRSLQRFFTSRHSPSSSEQRQEQYEIEQLDRQNKIEEIKKVKKLILNLNARN